MQSQTLQRIRWRRYENKNGINFINGFDRWVLETRLVSANTTYAELKADSEWCKNQTKLGAPRSEIIEQYEVCMKGKG